MIIHDLLVNNFILRYILKNVVIKIRLRLKISWEAGSKVTCHYPE